MDTIAKWKTDATSEFVFVSSSHLGLTVYPRSGI